MDRMGQLKELLKQSPKDSFLRHAMALELEKTGDNQAAIQTFMELLTEDPDYVGSYYQLGRLLEKVKEDQMAIEWYEKGVAVARQAGEKRAQNELQSALDELLYD